MRESCYYISAALLSWMGRQLGGEGQAQEVRTAIAWANVPTIWSGTLLIPELILFREEFFTSETPRLDASPPLAIVLMGIGAIQLVIGLWSIVIFYKSLGEAHRFSAWRAFGTTILTSLVVVSPIVCLIVGIGVLTLLGSRT